MLRESSQLNQDEILWVDSPTVGIGYQMIAALQRLGTKSMIDKHIGHAALSPLQALESESLAQSAASAALLTPTEALRTQRALSSDEWQTLTATCQKAPMGAHVVVILPLGAADSPELESLLNQRLEMTAILIATPVGFRDQGFFESVVAALRTQNGVEWERLKKWAPFAGIFISDLCGFLISIFWNAQFYQKVLLAPETSIDPPALLRDLESTLEFNSTMWERWRVRWQASIPSVIINPTPAATTTASLTPQKLLDLLPTTITPLNLWAKKVAVHLERSPESDLHFPPARTP